MFKNPFQFKSNINKTKGQTNGGVIRTRIAPSPTGALHIGTARTALFCWIFAKQNNGEFILRIEDTDIERSDPKFENDIVDGLKWLNIDWDNKDIYRQSERLDIYEKYIQKLLNEKKAFWCSHSREELAKEREDQMTKKEAPRHICEFRDGGTTNGIIRLKNDFKKEIKFNDLIRGEISFDAQLFGDLALAKDVRVPLYNFAVVVDDFDMRITHVIRGEDHIPNTPKQILIQKALGFSESIYAHLPLILGSDRSKLSKRDGATSVNEYKKDGYLPRAVFNFMALLGWHPSGAIPKDEQEIFSADELLKEFSFDRIQKGGAVFNPEKLDWMNQQYIKLLDKESLASYAKGFLPEEEWQKQAEEKPGLWLKIVELERERINKFSEIPEKVDYFFKAPFAPRLPSDTSEKELLKWKGAQSSDDIVRHLKYLLEVVEGMDEGKFGKEEIESSIMPYAEKEGRGEVLWPFRVSLCGKKNSPGPFEIAEILGKEEVLRRVKYAIELLMK